MSKNRILIVDDSVVARQMVSNAINRDPTLEVVGVAANGHIALAKIPQVNPDLIILDLEMPEMDGLETLTTIRRTYAQLPVVMFSALTERGAEATLEALSQGAQDYVTKPVTQTKEEALQYIREQLLPKIKALCAPPSTPPVLERSPLEQGQTGLLPGELKPVVEQRPPIQIIAIGVSTGGPNALAQLLPTFPPDLPVPVVIVQHMPPIFTRRLAERLAAQCQIKVAEAVSGCVLKPGQAWIAPGDYHMEVTRDGVQMRLYTHQNPPENSCRPAVDVLFRSVVKAYGATTLGIVLTGMGQDGLHGCTCIRNAGGQVFVQNQASSVVWGMPGMIANAGLADQVLPLEQLPAMIFRCISARRL